MDPCPHCGEPIEEGAESCPHCGSDFETGWSPDQDYYAVELPEDDPDWTGDNPPEAAPFGWESVLNWSVVSVAGLVFLGAGAHAHRDAGLPLVSFAPFPLLLLACLVFFHRWVSAAR